MKMNPSIFKTYDIRGIYPEEVNEEAIFEISKALGRYFGGGEILVARDGRLSSPQLYRAAIRGLLASREHSQKNRIIKLGIATTPMFYFLVGKLRAEGGIMITASHNPKNYNGLKAMGRGVKFINGKLMLKIVKKSKQ
ncbi:MAG: hypothetical protein HY378_01665 [Candidatus Brennerbacteria bacterium]|nr:hypothetical protein [Candidatus Brennerbacteria bacterium]